MFGPTAGRQEVGDLASQSAAAVITEAQPGGDRVIASPETVPTVPCTELEIYSIHNVSRLCSERTPDCTSARVCVR